MPENAGRYLRSCEHLGVGDRQVQTISPCYTCRGCLEGFGFSPWDFVILFYGSRPKWPLMKCAFSSMTKRGLFNRQIVCVWKIETLNPNMLYLEAAKSHLPKWTTRIETRAPSRQKEGKVHTQHLKRQNRSLEFPIQTRHSINCFVRRETV